MKYNKIIIGAALGLMFFSCKNEEPFGYDINEGEGRLVTTGLTVEVKSEELTTRASNLPEAEEFTVSICKEDTPYEAFVTYQYKDVPEIVTLPSGNYIVKAFYGDDSIVAAFDAPAYYGESELIKVENGKVCYIQNPIVCTLYNVRISITFDEELRKVMEDDVKVTVKVGESGSLDFGVNSSDGFFKYDENSTTLAATFTGTVNGAKITEIKNYDNVKRGTYYRLSFKLRGVEVDTSEPDPSDPENPGEENNNGNANGTVIVDATLTFHDHSDNGGVDATPEREEYLEDERFPNSGKPGNGGDQPGEDQPGEEDPGNSDDANKNKLPELTSDDVDLSITTDISEWPEGKPLAVNIVTPSVLSKFVCKIESETLDGDALEEVGLKSELDLINDTDLFEKLSALGFPVGEDITNPKTTNEKGEYIIKFDITQFVELLNALGEGEHHFIFYLQNEAGESVSTLKLKS